MRTVCSLLAATWLVALVPHVLQGQTGEAGGVEAVAPEALSFQPYEGDPEARIAVLYGNPAESGPFVVRLKVPPDWTGRPHTHGGTELVTFLSGTCYFAHGDALTREAAKQMLPGSFIALPAGTPMQGFSGEEGCVVDVHGEGPFTTRYLDEEEGGGS